MAHKDLLDNVKRLQTINFDYLKSRVANWKQEYLSEGLDSGGCFIAKQTSSTGYARMTLRFQNQQWHVPAYTAIAFVEGLLPKMKFLETVKTPIVSHLCGRGALGCCTLSHLVFGESQEINMDRKAKACNRIMKCSTCKTCSIANPCLGHGPNPLCIPPPIPQVPVQQRLQEIDEAIERLLNEKRQITHLFN